MEETNEITALRAFCRRRCASTNRGNFDLLPTIMCASTFWEELAFAANAANTTREDFDILCEYDVLLRKCAGAYRAIRPYSQVFKNPIPGNLNSFGHPILTLPGDKTMLLNFRGIANSSDQTRERRVRYQRFRTMNSLG